MSSAGSAAVEAQSAGAPIGSRPVLSAAVGTSITPRISPVAQLGTLRLAISSVPTSPARSASRCSSTHSSASSTATG